jgi:hypothetical protein
MELAHRRWPGDGASLARRRPLASLVAVALIAGAGLVVTGAAQAGTYQISQCADPGTGRITGVMADWLAPNARVVNSCPSGGVFGIEMHSMVLGGYETAAHALEIPAGQPNLTLRAAELRYRSLPGSGSTAYHFVSSGGTRLVDEYAGTDHRFCRSA